MDHAGFNDDDHLDNDGVNMLQMEPEVKFIFLPGQSCLGGQNLPYP